MARNKPEPAPEPEPEPEEVESLQERQDMVADAKQEIETIMMDVAVKYKISTPEILFILSDILADFAQEAMMVEHDQYFGPAPKSEG